MTLPSIYIYQTVIYCKSNLDKCNTNGIYHSYNTRNKEILSQPKNKTSAFQRTPPPPKRSTILRCFPNEIKSESSLRRFGTCLVEYLTKGYNYSAQQFTNNTNFSRTHYSDLTLVFCTFDLWPIVNGRVPELANLCLIA